MTEGRRASEQEAMDEHGQSPELSAFLQKVDGQLLASIFQDVASHCGPEASARNFIPLASIRSSSPYEGASGGYNAEGNWIQLQDIENFDVARHLTVYKKWLDKSPEEILQSSLSEIIKAEGSLDINRLEALIHEETHAVTKRECPQELSGGILKTVWAESADDERYIRHLRQHHQSPVTLVHSDIKHEQIGISQQFKPGMPIDHRYHPLSGDRKGGHLFDRIIFTLLNEAITEKLARELTVKYLEQSGWTDPEAIQTFRLHVDGASGGLAYELEVQLLNGMIEKISQVTGVESQVVWQSLVRALFTGETFEDEDVRALFAETFGEGFLQEFSHASLTTELMNEFEEQDFNDFVEKYKLSVPKINNWKK